jgi:D-sedoheptulose 7-phosphate isomerase
MSGDVKAYSERYLKETVESLSGSYITEGLQKLAPILKKARESGGTVFFFGNGGSASTASHLANDLAKLTIKEGAKRYRCISLSDPLPTILAWANDASYADIFCEQLKNLGKAGDVAIGISGSGNSPNVLKGLEEARRLKMTTVGLIGMGGGKMKDLCDVKVIVPSQNMQHIEDLHLLIGHVLTACLRDVD